MSLKYEMKDLVKEFDELCSNLNEVSEDMEHIENEKMKPLREMLSGMMKNSWTELVLYDLHEPSKSKVHILHEDIALDVLRLLYERYDEMYQSVQRTHDAYRDEMSKIVNGLNESI